MKEIGRRGERTWVRGKFPRSNLWAALRITDSGSSARDKVSECEDHWTQDGKRTRLSIGNDDIVHWFDCVQDALSLRTLDASQVCQKERLKPLSDWRMPKWPDVEEQPLNFLSTLQKFEMRDR